MIPPVRPYKSNYESAEVHNEPSYSNLGVQISTIEFETIDGGVSRANANLKVHAETTGGKGCDNRKKSRAFNPSSGWIALPRRRFERERRLF